MNAAGLTPALCQEAMDGVGSGVAMSLRAVDCAAAATSQAAFGRLFASDGALLPALTILLTLYVAFFAFGLITGRSTLGISALTPRMVTLGLVLTFATSWAAYQGTMYNLVIGAPNQIANILTGTEGSATTVFADKIDVVFAALIEASGDEATEGAPSTFSPPGLLWLGGTLLLLGTVGLLATCKIALAILMALGPIFVVLALFNGTRGLFTGWLKGVVLLAITPLFAVLGGSLMLELAVPVLRALTVVPGEIEPRAAMAFFMIGAVHMALMIMVLKVAGTMVAGWTVFGLTGRDADKADNAVTAAAAARGAATAVVAAGPAGAARPGSVAPSRDIRMTAASLPSAANDRGGTSTVSTRETRIIGAAPAGAGSTADAAGPSRARGVGSRFRAAPPRGSKSRTTP